jgi:hypothetical protein
MDVSGQLHAPVALPPGKESPVPIGYEAGWAPEPVCTTWRRENSLTYRGSNSDPSVVQPVASRYTDYASLHRRCIRNVVRAKYKTVTPARPVSRKDV